MVADLTVVSGGVAAPVAAVITGTIIGGTTAGAAGGFFLSIISMRHFFGANIIKCCTASIIRHGEALCKIAHRRG